MLEHRIQDDEQFAHAGRQRHLLGLPRLTEPLIERANHGIETGGDDRPHIGDCAGMAPASPHRACPTQQPTIATEGHHSHQGRDLLVCQVMGPGMRIDILISTGVALARATARNSHRSLPFDF